MTVRRDALLQAKVKILKALAHESRLTILEALESSERSVSEVQQLLGTDLSTASRHLSALREAGLVSARREGPHTRYALRVPCALKFFGCLDAVLEAEVAQHQLVEQQLRARPTGAPGRTRAGGTR